MSGRVVLGADGVRHDTVPAVVIVNPATGGVVSQETRGGGAVDANTTRVTLATDGPGVAALSSIDTKTPALVGGASPVGATARTCLWAGTISVTSTAQTLQALAMASGMSTGIPAGAVTVEIQPAGTIRLSRWGSFTPTATTGRRVDDGDVVVIDSTLSDVRLIAASTTAANVSFFDRV